MQRDLRNVRRRIVAGAILLASPFYVFCGMNHICMAGHMQHPPYSMAHYANDVLWITCFLTAGVFCWKSNIHKRTTTFVLLALLFLLRIPLGSGGGASFIVELPLLILAAIFAIQSLCSAATDFSQAPREEKIAHRKKVAKHWGIAAIVIIGVAGAAFGTIRFWKLVRQLRAPVIAVSTLPFSQDIALTPGGACIFKFPDDKTLAVWCERTGPISLPGDSDLDLSYGEKPFERLEIAWIPQEDGSRVSGPYKSYIRSGGVMTWSSGPGHEYELYVGDKYRVGLREEGDKKGKLPVEVSIRLATSAERVRPEDEVDHLVSPLKMEDPAKRNGAIKKLQESLMHGSTYATPRWEYIVSKVQPLSEDPNPDVKRQAVHTLKVLGDLDSIMGAVTPKPTGGDLAAGTARSLGQFVKRSQNTSGKKAVYDHVRSFLESDDPQLRAFAVSFFTYADDLPEIRQHLIDAQKDPSVEVRLASILAMERVYPEREIPSHRIPMLSDESPEVVIMVMQSSVGYGSERELPLNAVREFINSDDKRIRLAAMNAIRFKDDAESESIFLPLTYNEDKEIKDAAICGLYGRCSKNVYQRFMELLNDDDPSVRRRIVDGLYFDEYVEAIPVLEEFVKTEQNELVLRKATESLNKLTRLQRKKQNESR